MKINLRTVESAVAFVDDVIKSAIIQRFFERRSCFLPNFVTAHRIFGARRKFSLVRQAESFINFVEKVNSLLNFAFNLFRRHINMGVVLREISDAEKSVKSAAEFVTVNKSQLCKLKRQFAVTVRTRFVNQH